jgi:hypothetical protein
MLVGFLSASLAVADSLLPSDTTPIAVAGNPKISVDVSSFHVMPIYSNSSDSTPISLNLIAQSPDKYNAGTTLQDGVPGVISFVDALIIQDNSAQVSYTLARIAVVTPGFDVASVDMAFPVVLSPGGKRSLSHL